MNPSMESLCLSFRDIPQTSKLFATFLEDYQRVAKYYGHAPSIGGVAAAAKEVKIDPAVRAGVVEVLREQNLKFGGAAIRWTRRLRVTSNGWRTVPWRL